MSCDSGYPTIPQDTLVESEYSRDDAEEILARVLSVVDSTEHFISQITTILNQVKIFDHQILLEAKIFRQNFFKSTF